MQERMKDFEAERDFYNKHFPHVMRYKTHDGARGARAMSHRSSAPSQRSVRSVRFGDAQSSRHSAGVASSVTGASENTF